MSDDKSASWRKSSHSSGTGNCVEVAGTSGFVAIRDTKQGGHGSVLEFSEATWREFLAATKNGEQSL